MTTIEEILIRLGIIDNASKGVDKVKEGVSSLGGEGRKAFHKMGEAGEFVKIGLERLAEKFPVLGNVIASAMGKAVPLIIGAAIAYEYVKRKIEEMNEVLDKMEDVTRSPMSKMAEATHNARVELEKTRRELKAYHDQEQREGRRAEREDATKNDLDAAKAQQQVDEDRITKAKEREQADLKSRLSGRDLAIAQYELELKYAKQIQDVRLKSAEKVRDINAEAKKAAAEEYQKAKDRRELWERLATNNKQEDLARRIEKTKQENTSSEQSIAKLEALMETQHKRAEDLKAEEPKIKTGQYQETRYTKAAREEAETQQRIYNEKAAIERRNTVLDALTRRFNVTNDELKKAQDAEKSATDELRKLENAVKDANRELGKLKVMPPQVVQPLPDNAGYNDRFRATVEELAGSGQWMQNRLFGGRPVGRPYWQQGPFARMAQEIMFDEAMAHQANDAGNLKARDWYKNRARVLRDQLGGAGVLKDSEYLDSMAKDFAAIRQMAQGVGLNVNPSNGK